MARCVHTPIWHSQYSNFHNSVQIRRTRIFKPENESCGTSKEPKQLAPSTTERSWVQSRRIAMQIMRRTETENRFLDTFSSLPALPLVASKEANNGCSIDSRIRICSHSSCGKGDDLASAPSARSWNVEIHVEDALL